MRCRLGLRPDPAGGAYSAPPDPLAVGRVGRRGESRGEGCKKCDHVLRNKINGPLNKKGWEPLP